MKIKKAARTIRLNPTRWFQRRDSPRYRVEKKAKTDREMNGLEFRRAEIAVAHAVGGNLQQIFEKRYAPTDHDGGEQRQRLIAQMPVPRERHEHIGKNQ